MVSLSLEQAPIFRQWLCHKLRIQHLRQGTTTISVIRDNQIAAVVAYSDANGIDCWMSVAGEGRWLNRSILPVFFRYPFEQLGCRRVSAFCKATNTHAIEWAKRFGFVQEGELRAYFDDGTSCIVLGLMKEDCKWVSSGKR